MIANQVKDGVSQLGAFGNLDALKISPASNVLARLVTKFRSAALIVSACSSSRAIQNGSHPCPASKVPTRKLG
jgi:hypothetical protein